MLDSLRSSYKEETDALRSYCDLIELRSDDAALVISPVLQGRILTSCTHPNSPGFGWVNHDLIRSGEFQPGINAYGGEDRFWIGPEAGQFALFFKPGQDFTQSNWQTPACIDTEAFILKEHNESSAFLTKNCVLSNYQGQVFDIEVQRRIRIYSKSEMLSEFVDLDPGRIQCVGFESENKIVNRSAHPWSKQTGLLNIWILGKFRTGDQCWAVMPAKEGYAINQNYFAADLNDRLLETKNFGLMKVDGKMKSKVGLSPLHDLNVLGSFDLDSGILTITRYHTDKQDSFLNSEWKIQDLPYSGDVLNIYNDGPDEDGRILGPYYELESSSSSKELLSGQEIGHVHQTYHFTGEFAELNKVAKQWLFVDLNIIKELINAG